MHVHVYHEAIGRKGSNDVASLIMKTLRIMNVLRRNDPGGKLVLFFELLRSRQEQHCAETWGNAGGTRLFQRGGDAFPYRWSHEERMRSPLQRAKEQVQVHGHVHDV